MFPKNFFPSTYFPSNYFAPAEIPNGHSGRDIEENLKENSTLNDEISILELPVKVETEVQLEFNDSLTNELIEDALNTQSKELSLLQEKLREEQEIELILAIISANDDF